MMKDTTKDTKELVQNIDNSYVWIGALSFEPRCVGSLEEIYKQQRTLGKSVIVGYPTSVIPLHLDRKRRKKHIGEMKKIIGEIATTKEPIFEKLHPYRLSDIEKYLNATILKSGNKKPVNLVLDITCLTKAHTIGVALWLVKNQKAFNNVIIAYTNPEQYISPARHGKSFSMWEQAVFAPCVLDPNFFYDNGDAIILLGHDGARLSLALAEFTPMDALLILCHEPEREQLQIVTRTSNARIIGQVLKDEVAGWALQTIDISNYNKLKRLVDSFAKETCDKKRRLVIYPFGPKIFIFASALAAINVDPSMVWYCYPIPKQYDVNYTLGIGKTRWFKN